MKHQRGGPRPQLYRLRRLASRLCVAGLPWIGLGCTELTPASFLVAPRTSPPAVEQVRAQGMDLENMAALQSLPPAASEGACPACNTTNNRVVPISLDTVLRLAGENNPQIRLAREKVCEACSEREVARYRWIPDLYVGPAFYRHEGGIQDQDGRLIHSSTGAIFGGLELNAELDPREIAAATVNAERKAWQQKGELTKVTSETLLDAANTYIDFLSAHTAVVIARELMKDIEALYERTKKLAESEPGVMVEVERIEADMAGRRLNLSRFQEAANSAAAKLALLLGMDPCVQLVPVDVRLAPLNLVDVSVPVCDLVARALTIGPGIREMEGILAMVHENIQRANGPGRFLPTFQVRMAEGAFGAGPGQNLSFDNRWDLGVQARWNLTEFVAQRERRCVTQARINQLHIGYEDLRRKLAVGVQQAYASIHSDMEQIHFAEEQIRHAEKAHDLSMLRLTNNIPGSTASEVLLSMQALALSQVNYLSSVRDFDKDQMRLLILLGASQCPGH